MASTEKTPYRLQLAFPGGPVQSYRVDEQNREVWFQPRPATSWRQLGSEEILIHLNLKTAVAGWLERRFGWRTMRLARPGQEG
jgi:hypothetical protein